MMKRAFVSIANSYVGCCVAGVLHRHGYEVVGSVREEGKYCTAPYRVLFCIVYTGKFCLANLYILVGTVQQNISTPDTVCSPRTAFGVPAIALSI